MRPRQYYCRGPQHKVPPSPPEFLSRKFSLVTRVSLVRLARFPWPRKDDTHRSVTAFFSRFPWPRKDDTHRSVTGFLRVVDANRLSASGSMFSVA